MLKRAIALSATTALTAVCLLAGQPAAAQSTGSVGREFPTQRTTSPRIVTNSGDQVAARSIEMGVGRSIVVDLPRDAKEVFVANPAIANAVVRSARKLFIIGVANGSTSIMALDGDGKQIAAFEMQIGKEPGLLAKTLKTAIPHADIRATTIGDSIVLTGQVETVLEAQKAVDIAKGFVGTAQGIFASSSGNVINSMTIRAKDQVMLKVTVAEVRRTAIKQLGVNLNGTWEVAGKQFGGLIDNSFPVAVAAPLSSIAAGAQVGSALEKSINVKMLERHGVLRTLAEPTLTAISGETAKFIAGGEIPVPRSESSSTGNLATQLFGGTYRNVTIEYKPYGVQLNFTPVVLSEGRISLSVNTEVTEIDTENNFRLDSTQVPAFRIRRAFTTIELPSGGSLVTAGLIQQSSRQALNGLPGIFNIPILGQLFRSRDFMREDTELMMIVTPYIAKPSAAGALSKPDDGFVQASDPATTLMGRINRVYGAAGTATPPTQYRGKVGFIHE
jgi:pilus assembly protein CpaC